ncbi:AraC family transcriptional regulator [Actinoallomurus rhizosphaericola]|uniref:AraC family transcriptional regulator n=1 Tax=Actinoallomurus rhizosphaericola TaxID=2952536 RepID=UPI00209065DD|nr:AraC family transcriptional regulator [Actinoallomurus rhizosphaericola]MCO5992923.1 AraC family transcriptional regulator [Actinoallomurus rhizosphaericola]
MDVLSDAVAVMRTGRPHSSRTCLRPPWGIRFRPQEGAGFHVILKGSCWLIPARGEPMLLGVGDVVLLPRELGHGIADTPSRTLTDVRLTYDDLANGRVALPVEADGTGAQTEMLCGAYRLDQSRPHPLLTELPDVVHLPARVGAHPALRGAIELLGHELSARPRPGRDAALTGLLDLLLLYMLRAFYEDRSDDAGTGWAAALRDPAVAAALRAVHDDPARPWTVESLAAEGGLSRAAFARRFTGTVGSPPLAYLTWWRMTIAARLLRDTDLPLRAVAQRTGYTSEFAFARAFKREFATAPGRYRAGTPDARPALTG